MAFDAHKNFAYSTVATAPSPATSGTSLTVATGDGSKFPATPFNATVWPAGAQPSDANAEIVRVTNISGDVLTLTRTQEGSSARSIVVGDQIANTITAKVITDLEAVAPATVIFVAAPTGVAATDTAAIQAAHDALPSTGGMVVLGKGTYVIDPTSPLAFSKPIYLKGQGRKATLLTLDSATVTPIGVTATGAIFEDFTLQNVHATAPTAGAGIAVTANGNRTRYRDIEIDSFYINIDQQYGNGWVADRCFINDYKSVGIKVQNIANTDSSDGQIANCQIATSVAATTYGILFNSGGNLRITDNQLYGGDAGHSNVGVCLSPLDGVNTSDIIIVGNSIEDFVYGVLGQLPGSATGGLQAIIIVGNEMYASTGGDCINFDMSTASRFGELIVTGNRLTGGSRGLVLGNIDTVVHGPNIRSGALGAPPTVNAGVTSRSAGGMTKLFDSTLGADTASIDTGASSIPSGFGSLLIQFVGRTDDAATTGGIDVTLNNDTGNNYDIEQISGANATASAVAANAQNKWGFAVTGASALAGYAGFVSIEIPGYDQTSWFKTCRASLLRVTDTAADCRTDHQAIGYRSTSAISRVKVAARSTAKLKAGSRLVIYGMP